MRLDPHGFFARRLAVTLLVALAGAQACDTPTQPDTDQPLRPGTTVTMKEGTITLDRAEGSGVLSVIVTRLGAVTQTYGVIWKWTSSNDKVVTVSGNGVLTPIGAGIANVTATSGYGSATAVVTVTDVMHDIPAEMTITAPDLLWMGDSVALRVAVRNRWGDSIGGAVRWASHSPGVAEVDSATGVARGRSSGTALIEVTTGTISRIASILVGIPIGAAIAGESMLATGTSSPFSATAVVAGTGRVAPLRGTWSSSAPTIASVDAAGVVIGHSAGSAVISHMSAVGVQSITVAVTSLDGQIVFQRMRSSPLIERLLLDGSAPTVLVSDPPRSSPFMARGGTRLAARCATFICVSDDDGRSWTTLPIPGEDPGLSHDGGTLAYIASAEFGRDLIIVSRDSGTRRIPVVYGSRPRPSPDGKQVLLECDIYLSYDATLCRVDESGTLTVFRDYGVSPEWSPDGLRVAFIEGDSLRVRTLSTGHETTIFAKVSWTGSIAWSPDGAHLATMRDGAIWIMRDDGSHAATLSIAQPTGGTVSHLSWAKMR